MTRPLILVSSVLLGIGLVAPTMTIYPKAGEFTWLMEIMDPGKHGVSHYSVLFGIIVELAEMNDWFMVVILSILSVVLFCRKTLCILESFLFIQDPKVFSL